MATAKCGYAVPTALAILSRLFFWSAMSWTATKSALRDLESELNCCLCGGLLKDPCTLSTCNHHFCNDCIHPVLQGGCFQCPECAVPMWMKDLYPNRQLCNIIRNMNIIKEITASEAAANYSISNHHTQLNSQEDSPETSSKSQDIFSDFGLPGNLEMQSCASETSVCKPKENRSNVRVAKAYSEQPLRNCRRTRPFSNSGSENNRSVVTISDSKSSLFSEGESTSSAHMTCDNHTSTSAEQTSSRSDCKSASRSSSNPTVNIDLTCAVLDEVGIKQKLREAAGVAAHLKTAIRQSEASPKYSKRDSTSLKISPFHGPDISAFEPSPPKKQQRDSTNTLGMSSPMLGRRNEKRNRLGETELHILAKKGRDLELCDVLKLSPDPNVRDYAGWTPLHEACIHGHVKAASLLLEHGAIVNVPGHGNDTPLHDAVANDHCNVASLLLQQGADVNIRNRNGLTARDVAHSDAMKEIMTESPSIANNCSLTTSPVLDCCVSPELVQEVVLLPSGLSQTQKALMANLVEELNAEVVSRFTDKVTHVVVNGDCGVCVCTFKFLCGVATGKWIVRFEWITQCISSHVWVEETPFEVTGVRSNDRVMESGCCKKARLNASLKSPGLFDGCSFFLTGDFVLPTPSKEELSLLIQLAGGRILVREPQVAATTPSCPFHASQHFTFNQFIVFDPSHENSRVTSLRLKSDTVAVVPATWILDSLSHFKLLSI